MSYSLQLEELLFPVEEHPVYAAVSTLSGERRLAVPGKKAIVNQDADRVLGIVSRDYRLVTNREAFDWARQCCQAAFPDTKPIEWTVESAEAPGTRGHCFIDLVHMSDGLDFSYTPAKQRPDAFAPFIRVTNSYNGLRALSFDIGFKRKVCSNGLIVKESIIRFKFTHLRRELGERIEFEVNHKRFAQIKARFTKDMDVLRHCAVPRRTFEPLLYSALSIRKPERPTTDRRIEEDWRKLQTAVAGLCDRYANELGENAYAVFNAITDLASHPPENRCVHRERNSFQRSAGEWVVSFGFACEQPEFSLAGYLSKTTEEKRANRPAPYAR